MEIVCVYKIRFSVCLHKANGGSTGTQTPRVYHFTGVLHLYKMFQQMFNVIHSIYSISCLLLCGINSIPFVCCFTESERQVADLKPTLIRIDPMERYAISARNIG